MVPASAAAGLAAAQDQGQGKGMLICHTGGKARRQGTAPAATPWLQQKQQHNSNNEPGRKAERSASVTCTCLRLQSTGGGAGTCARACTALLVATTGAAPVHSAAARTMVTNVVNPGRRMAVLAMRGAPGVLLLSPDRAAAGDMADTCAHDRPYVQCTRRRTYSYRRDVWLTRRRRGTRMAGTRGRSRGRSSVGRPS